MSSYSTVFVIALLFCVRSQPQCYGLGGYRERLRSLASSSYPQHIWPLDPHPLTRGTTNARFIWHFLKSIMCKQNGDSRLFCFLLIPYQILVNVYYLSSVIGALIGKQEGRNIEVMNSFELLSHTIDDRVHIDKEYYYTKEEQCKSVVCGCI